MKKMLYFNLLILLIILGTSSSVLASLPEETYVIAPQELKGMETTPIQITDIFVQKVTFKEVVTLPNEDLVVVDGNGEIIVNYPKESAKVYIRQKSTKKNLGFITLNPTPLQRVASLDTKGEYLFYQTNEFGEEGRVFNNLTSATEGNIYFFRLNKNSNLPPLLLYIGTIQNGELAYESYLELSNKKLSLRR